VPVFGTFDTMPLADLAQWIHDSNADGALTISVDTEETYVLFEKGQIVAAGSGDPLRLDIGQILLSEKIITEEELTRALTAVQGGGSLAVHLEGSGLVGADLLERIRRDHAFELVLDLFFHVEGSFHFSNQEPDESLMAPHELARTTRLARPISTRNVVIEAMRRLDDWRRIREVIPNHFTVVMAVGDASEDPVWRALKAAGRPLSVGDLCAKVGGSRFAVHKSLLDLHSVGMIALDELLDGKSPIDHLGPVDVLVKNARVLIEEEQFDEAREILSTVTNLAPENGDARELLKGLRRLQLEHLYSQIPPHKVPILAVSREELGRLALAPREVYLASRLVGNWDVATLVIATPLGELETLRFLRKFLHAGIARFAE